MISGTRVKSHAQKYFIAHFANGGEKILSAKVSIAQTDNMLAVGYPSESEGLAQCDEQARVKAQKAAAELDSPLLLLEVVNYRFDTVIGTIDLSPEGN